MGVYLFDLCVKEYIGVSVDVANFLNVFAVFFLNVERVRSAPGFDPFVLFCFFVLEPGSALFNYVDESKAFTLSFLFDAI